VAEPALVALAERLQGICIGRHLTVATAESCTGGLVAEAITAVPGSSAYFRGALVTYSNEAKTTILGVSKDLLAAHGAVSAQVARAMATGARARLGTSLAISITGIAGPDGGSDEKPVGLTYLGLASASGVEVRKRTLGFDRAENRDAAATVALQWLVDAASRSGA
jgi:PncC family amidohydrolase